MKKQKNKQAKKASKLAKAENLKQKTITVKNAEGEPNTEAVVLVQNKIDYTPKVSVIIPVYNVEQYLRECLNSVIKQTLKEIEIICVDDGSTDNSLSILKEYAEKDHRIIVISRENKGVGYSRNQGIQMSEGEFIAFMDPDDYYPDLSVLNLMYNTAKKHNVKICGGSLIVYDEKRKLEIKQKEKSGCFSENKIWLYQDFQYDYGYQRYIYDTQMIKNDKIYFPEYKRFQDPPFMIKAFSTAQKFYAITEYTYAYRWAHKEIQWTEEKVFHLLCGLKDDLMLAVHNNLWLLYATTLSRIKKDYKKIILSQESQRITDVKNKIMEICLYTTKLNIAKIKYTPKVSVVLPIYNAEPYLRECLDSVVNQTLKEIEIICVNDGSTDNSLDIIKEYANKDNRIVIIDKPNAGYGQTMNCGISIARGEYIGIVEPDDFVKLDMYETLYNKAKEFHLDIIKSDYFKITKNNNAYQYETVKLINDKNYYNNVMRPDEYLKLLTVMTINPAGIFKKSFLLHYDIRHNETAGAAYQDNGFWVQTMYQAHRIMFLDVPFYCYRQDNPNQSMKKRNNIWTIPNEYDFIDGIFNKNKELSKYRGIYCHRKFLAYMYHLKTRLSYDYWEEYLKRMYLNFYTEDINGFLDLKYFSLKEKEELQLILNQNFSEYIKQYASIKVSIIVPVYNTEKYLRECLNSLINQTLQDIEIICIDDGSTDNSLNILNEYAQKDKRIKVLTQNNQKQGAARNRGLAIAKGEYIQFVDSDDYIVLNACEDLYKKCTEYNLEMLIFGGVNFNNKTKKLIPSPAYQFSYVPQNYKNKLLNFKDCSNFVVNMPTGACFTIYKKQYIDNLNIVFAESIYFEDNVFFVKAITNVNRLFLYDQVYYYRRIHDLSTTQNWNVHFTDYIKAVRTVLSYLKEAKVEDNIYQAYMKLYIRVCISIYQKLSIEERHRCNKKMECLLQEYAPQQVSLITNHVIKSYLFILYNIIRRKSLIFKLIYLRLQSFRVDAKNFGTADNALVAIAPQTKVSAPAWFANAQGKGNMIEGTELKQSISLKAIQSGKLQLTFKGPDKRANNVRYPLWIDYKSIKIDGKEILSAPVATWHDKPFKYEMPVKDGQVVKIAFEQQPHQYAKSELKDVILKLNPNNNYIKTNADKIVAKLAKTYAKPITLKNGAKTAEVKLSPEEVERQKVLNLLQQSLAASQNLSKEISNLKGQIESLQKEVKTLKTEQVTTQKMLVNEQTLLQKRRKLN